MLKFDKILASGLPGQNVQPKTHRAVQNKKNVDVCDETTIEQWKACSPQRSSRNAFAVVLHTYKRFVIPFQKVSNTC